MVSSGHSGRPSMAVPMEGQAFGVSFCLLMETQSRSPVFLKDLGSFLWAGCPTLQRTLPRTISSRKGGWLVPWATSPVAILLVAPRWRCRTTALSHAQPRAPQRALPSLGRRNQQAEAEIQRLVLPVAPNAFWNLPSQSIQRHLACPCHLTSEVAQC